jgi:hypothetical protein
MHCRRREDNASSVEGEPFRPSLISARGTFRSLGTDTRMGIKLYSTFVAAGLPAPTLRLQAIAGGGVGGGTGGLDWLQVVAEIVGTLLPKMERRAVLNAAEAGIETLVHRLSAELAAGGCIVVAPSLISAWSRV